MLLASVYGGKITESEIPNREDIDTALAEGFHDKVAEEVCMSVLSEALRPGCVARTETGGSEPQVPLFEVSICCFRLSSSA